MKCLVSASLAILLSGCATADSVRAVNRQHLALLSLGMPKAEVLQVMGTNTITTMDYDGNIGQYGQNIRQTINNPYRVETLKGKDGEVYEVLFYYTDLKKKSEIL